MRILIAPNAFKNSLSAPDVARCLAEGINRVSPHFSVQCFPVADGGDGTAALLTDLAGGKRLSVKVSDPLGRQIDSSFGLSADGHTAFIEMADASGLRLLKPHELNPLAASSFGTGQLILAALDAGAKQILLCLGGSATVDGGAGMLHALGLVFLDTEGHALKVQPEVLTGDFRVDGKNIDQRIAQTGFIVLCDVDNFLLGVEGAAATFGPQKGAGPQDVADLEGFLQRLDEAAFTETGKRMSTLKHGGAAGGAAAALSVFLDAQLVPGADFFLDYGHFDEKLQEADLVITGEGSLDAQTLQGKAPFAVAVRAAKRGIPVLGVAGNVADDDHEELDQLFTARIPISHRAMDLDTAIAQTEMNLIRTGGMLGRILSISNFKAPNAVQQ